MPASEILQVLSMLVSLHACAPVAFNTGTKQLVVVVCPFTRPAPGEDAQKAPEPPVKKQVWHG